MQRLIIEKTTLIEAKRLWELLTDVNNYPKYIKFVTKIKNQPAAFEEGICWSDITNIVWIPLEIRHKIIKIEKYKKLIYELALPFGGTMMEECNLTAVKEGTRVSIEIEFTFKNIFLDFIVGIVLKKRLKKMLGEAVMNLKKLYEK